MKNIEGIALVIVALVAAVCIGYMIGAQGLAGPNGYSHTVLGAAESKNQDFLRLENVDKTLRKFDSDLKRIEYDLRKIDKNEREISETIAYFKNLTTKLTKLRARK